MAESLRNGHRPASTHIVMEKRRHKNSKVERLATSRELDVQLGGSSSVVTNWWTPTRLKAAPYTAINPTYTTVIKINATSVGLTAYQRAHAHISD